MFYDENVKPYCELQSDGSVKLTPEWYKFMCKKALYGEWDGAACVLNDVSLQENIDDSSDGEQESNTVNSGTSNGSSDTNAGKSNFPPVMNGKWREYTEKKLDSIADSYGKRQNSALK